MKQRVLFLCTGNSARSQIAAGLVNHYLADTWEAASAGTAPAADVHPLAVHVMAELGIDISDQRPRSTDEYRGLDFDQVITLCDNAAANCPAWLGRGRLVHLGFLDPAASTGSKENRLAVFRRVRDAIRERVLGHLAHGGGLHEGEENGILFLNG